MTSGRGWDSVRRVLCVRTDGMGDVLMTQPALRAIKESAPECEITLLASDAGAEVARLLPEVDRVITYAAPWMKHSTPDVEADLEMIRQLRTEQFDAAVIFTVYSQNPLPAALLCYLAGIPRRLAYCRENPYALLTDWVRETEPEQQVRHEVRRQLDLVASVGYLPSDARLRVIARDEAIERMRARLAACEVAIDRPWFALHPGATAESRRYPLEQYAEAIALLAGDGWQPLVVTGRGDAGLGERLRELAGGCAAVAIEGLDDLSALLTLAPVFVANNSGPAHLAAAVGTPVVDLYALTNPQHTPWGVPSRVLFQDVPCRYCYRSVCPEGHHECLRGVTPLRIAHAVRDLVAIQESTLI